MRDPICVLLYIIRKFPASWSCLVALKFSHFIRAANGKWNKVFVLCANVFVYIYIYIYIYSPVMFDRRFCYCEILTLLFSLFPFWEHNRLSIRSCLTTICEKSLLVLKVEILDCNSFRSVMLVQFYWFASHKINLVGYGVVNTIT